MYGSVVGQAFPLLSIPTTAISAFTLVLMPEISEHFYKKDYLSLKNAVEKALKITVVISAVFIPVFAVLGEEIGILVFSNHDSGKYLSISAFLMLFMGLSSISTSILNSMGLENKTLIFFVISGLLMIVSIWILPSYIGIYSLLIGFTFVFGLSSVFNLILLSKSCKVKPKYLKFTFLSLIAIIPSIILGIMLKSLLLSLLGTFLTFLVVGLLTAIFTLAFMFGLGVTEYQSVKRLFLKKLKYKKRPA
jgi:stage V sporulation protein B